MGGTVLVWKEEAIAICDVLAGADIYQGTFYPYFTNRDEWIAPLAEHSLISLATDAAIQTTDYDPAPRFAY